jgi:hypothetical protein
LAVPDPALDLDRAVRGTSGPENQDMAPDPPAVQGATSDRGNPGQEQAQGETGLVRVAAEWS